MSKPILICGVASESPLAILIDAAERLGVDCHVIDQRHLAGQDIEVGVRAGKLFARWWNGVTSLDLQRCGGAYTRLVPVSAMRDVPSDPHGRLHCHYFVDGLSAWLEMTDLPVVNRTAAGMSNSSKPWQAQLIQRAGFATPPSLLSNDPQAVRDFLRRHGRVVFKSASGVRSIVSVLDDAHAARLDQVKALPTLFQAFVPGVNYRAHVLGQEVFCTRVDSTATDYRYAEREGLEAELHFDRLPDEVAQRCVALAASMGLELAGIDLKRRPDGEYVCFEVNPSPAYSCFGRESSHKIAEALVRYLSGGKNRASHRKPHPSERRSARQTG